MIPLPVLEEVIDAAGVAARIEALLPIGARRRQLTARTLLAGLCLTQADHRPAHLTRVHQALTALSEDEQRRLGVITDWKHGPHKLTYRQTERTFGLVAGRPRQGRTRRAAAGDAGRRSATTCSKRPSRRRSRTPAPRWPSDWTDMESFSRPPPAKGGTCADPEASWGHRKNNLLRSEDELFFGYYFSAGDHDARRERPRRPRARPPRHALIMPA